MDGDALLSELVAKRMAGADSQAVAVVTAMTGLLARVAYADADYSSAERTRVHEELSMVLGLTQEDIDVVCSTLETHIGEIGRGPTQAFTRVLRERFDRHMRADTVRVLVELAAVDQVIDEQELVIIRRVAEELELQGQLVDALVARARELSQG